MKRAPQWFRRLGCFLLEHDERAPDAEHTWRYCARCGATITALWGAGETADDDEGDA